MRTFTRILALAAFLALHGAWGAGLHAAGVASDTTATADTTSTAAADTAKAAADTTKVVDPFVPRNTSYARASSGDVGLGSKMSAKSEPGGGWVLIGSINVDRKRYRTRKMEDLNQALMARVDKERAGLYSLSLGVADTYRKSKTLSKARYGLDLIYDNQEADIAFQFVKPILGASASNLGISGQGSRGQNDFKYDRSLSGGVSGAMTYRIGDFLSVRGGAGTGLRRETSDIGAKRFGPLSSGGDTLSAGVSYSREESATFDVSYTRYSGIERKVSPPRGSSYEILNDPSKAKQEKTTNTSEQLAVKSKLAPFSYLGLDFSFDHSIADQKYTVDTMLTNKTERNVLSGTANYQYAAKGLVRVNATTSENVTDWAGSLASYREREHALSMGLSQAIGDSISISANGAGSLRQRFYLKQTANPHDYDILYYKGDCGFRAPLGKITASANAAIERYETINIDESYSRDNRVDHKYQVGPTIMIRPADWVTITQDYIVRIEYTDFVYTEDKNYLNRSTTLNTQTSFNLFPALTLSLRNSYLMKDTGSYIMSGGERRYYPSNNTHENTLDITVGYAVSSDFTLKAESGFRIQRNDVFGAEGGRKIVVASTTYDSGDMRLGLTRRKKLGRLGALNLDVSYVRNYGPFVTRQFKEYVEANSELSLNF